MKYICFITNLLFPRKNKIVFIESDRKLRNCEAHFKTKKVTINNNNKKLNLCNGEPLTSATVAMYIMYYIVTLISRSLIRISNPILSEVKKLI